MKIKNKIYTLLGVFTLVGLTHSLTLKDLNAALTAPASFDLNYRYDGADLDAFTLGTTSYGTSINVGYTRTADGVYYNYTNTSNYSTHPSIIPNGLSITSTFNRSNTTWVAVDGLYYAEDSRIGSDNTVGTLTKNFITINNQTSKDYIFWVDTSSTGSSHFITIKINNNSIRTGDGVIIFASNYNLSSYYLPAYSILEFTSRPNNLSNAYFDAWYLKDLGVSASYDAGYDAGELIGYDDGYANGLGNNPNILLTGFQAMVGILVNFSLMIVNLEVFGVSLLGIFSIIVLFTGIVWTLKLIRG